MCRNEEGYTLIEIAAVLAIMAMAAMTAGTLLLAGMRYFERENRYRGGEELTDRIGEQVVKLLTYAEGLEISNEWEERDNTRVLSFDQDGHVSLDGEEIFGSQYFRGRTLLCSVESDSQTVHIKLDLMDEEEKIYETEISITLINMELNGAEIQKRSGVVRNQTEPVVFYIQAE